MPTVNVSSIRDISATLYWIAISSAKSYNITIFESTLNELYYTYIDEVVKDSPNKNFFIGGLNPASSYRATVFAVSKDNVISSLKEVRFTTAGKFLKGALNPNFLNLTINIEKNFALGTYWSPFLTCFC